MLAGLLTAPAGCSLPSAPQPQPTSVTAAPAPTAAQSTLVLLAQAARGQDRAGFNRLVSDRDSAFAERARQLYGNLSRLPLDQLSLRLQPGERELAAARRAVLGPEAWRQPATVTWRLAGESSAAEHTVWLTFAVQDGTPLLAGTSDRPSGEPAAAPIWWLGPVSATPAGAGWLLVGEGQSARLWSGRVTDAVAQVRRRVTAGAAADWTGAVVVEVPATRRDFEAVLGAAPGSYADIAAVTTAEGPAAAAVRVVVNPEVARRLAPVGVAVVLVHETVHVATRSADSPAPTWIVEGLADYVALSAHPEAAGGAAEPLLQRVRDTGPPSDLPTDDEFRAGAPDLSVSYAEAWLACRHIAEDHAPAALQRLYTALDAGVPLDQALRDELGVSLSAFLAGWRRYLARAAEG